MSFLTAAEQVLTEVGEPMHYRALCDRILAAGLVETTGKTPWDSLNAMLSVDIKRRGDASRFMRVSAGHYALTEWGLDPAPTDTLKARTSHLPTWTVLRAFLRVMVGRTRDELTALRTGVRGLTGRGLDFTQPESWLDELDDDARALGHALWTGSGETLNPRYVNEPASVAARYDLLDEDDDGRYALSDDGRDLVDHAEGTTVHALDRAEGVSRVLALVAELGPARSGELLEPYMEWCLEHAGLRSEATGRVSLGTRLANLADRGLAHRKGMAWAATPAGLAWLGDDPQALTEGDDGPTEEGAEVLRIVREINEQQSRVRARIHEAIATMDPYAFEHLVKRLLDEMGYEGVEVTRPSNDKGVDVVGRIQVGITPVTEVIQAKRQQANVGRPVLDALRGSLYRWSAQRGTIITTASFSKGARECAFDLGTAPIQLIDGDRLVDLLIENGIGLEVQQVKLWKFDPSPFGAVVEDEGDDEGDGAV